MFCEIMYLVLLDAVVRRLLMLQLGDCKGSVLFAEMLRFLNEILFLF